MTLVDFRPEVFERCGRDIVRFIWSRKSGRMELVSASIDICLLAQAGFAGRWCTLPGLLGGYSGRVGEQPSSSQGSRYSAARHNALLVIWIHNRWGFQASFWRTEG